MSVWLASLQLGFSPVLTAISLGTVFTVVSQAALNVAFAPLGIPALIAPFVLTTWSCCRGNIWASATPER